MKLKLAGFEGCVELGDGAAVLEAHDERLFSRICASLYSERGGEALEPFLLWDDEGDEKSARNAFLFVANPFDLPWNDRGLLGDVRELVEDAYYADDEARRRIEGLALSLLDEVAALALRLRSSYGYEVEWDIGKLLKAFDLGVDRSACESLLDNLILFLEFASDSGCERVVTFLNLKSFLDDQELEAFYQAVFSSGLNVLLLESRLDGRAFESERKMVIDKDFLCF